MVADRQNGLEEETRQLIEYKILLTFVLDGNEAAAVPKLNQQKKGSAAFYYARAAVARQHGREAEAAEWLASAAEHFPAATNKLYAESFYEIGWENRSSGETRESFEIVPAEERTARKTASAWTDLTEAQRAFLERRTEAAQPARSLR